MNHTQRAAFEGELMLTPKELAERWRMSTHTLGMWRQRGEGPEYIKLPMGGILYRASVILEHEASGARGLTVPRVVAAIEGCTSVEAAARKQVAEHVREQLT